MLYEKDIQLGLLLERRVTVIGFGAQGRAQASNLKDSGVGVVVALRHGSNSMARVEHEGLQHGELVEAVQGADVIVMLVPDTSQQKLYETIIHQHAKKSALLVFAHGFNLLYKRIVPRPDMDVVLVAPLGIGDQVRDVYCRGGGVPALFAVFQDSSGNARQIGLSYAAALGHGRAGIIETTVAEETETDLFSEQVVLCGGLTHLIEAAFDTLVEAGYSAEVAYFCCVHEVKLIADLIHERGIAGMRESISPVAEFGDYEVGDRLVDDSFRKIMKDVLDDIQSGRFADRVDAESREFNEIIAKGRRRARRHLLEKTGARLRSAMPWLKEK